MPFALPSVNFPGWAQEERGCQGTSYPEWFYAILTSPVPQFDHRPGLQKGSACPTPDTEGTKMAWSMAAGGVLPCAAQGSALVSSP